PMCSAEYPVRDGIVYFDDTAPAPPRAPDEAQATRIAAALDLTEPRAVALLEGMWGAHAHLVATLSPSRVILRNPPADVGTGEGVSIIRSAVVPLAPGSLAAAAASADTSADDLAALVRALRDGGRLLAPAQTPLPPDVAELARDDD